MEAAPVRVRTMGSSPRVRGKRGGGAGEGTHDGLIPARAGKTVSASGKDVADAAHPRACGENWRGGRGVGVLLGSSPRVRGKLHPEPHRPRRGRLIPARAGKTSPPPRPTWPPSAHPRACGENRLFPARATAAAGSSPRVRGKPGSVSGGTRSARLIPARAGKTSCRSRPPTRNPAHPRACGENACTPRTGWAVAGSSPRVRGKQAHVRLRRRPARLIPARAGKTSPAPAPGAAGTAHPRACGENADHGLGSGWSAGSSPRVRGKPVDGGGHGVVSGLIPARAGKTPAALTTPATRGAHPRVCGENMVSTKGTARSEGSSPRVRGKRPCSSPPIRTPRLIPACAGKT